MKRHTAPIITAVLLLLPVLYVGSYFALMKPKGVVDFSRGPANASRYPSRHYSNDFELEYYATQLFWPLEQIDRKVRPGAWGE